MAGFQQAANALTGSFGAVAGRVGLYSELVGKNQKLIGELKTANKSLEESNEKITGLNDELDKKNEELVNKNEELRYKNMQLNETINVSSSIAQDYVRMSKMEGRIEAHERAVASRNKMLDIVYGPIEHKTAGPTGPKY